MIRSSVSNVATRDRWALVEDVRRLAKKGMVPVSHFLQGRTSRDDQDRPFLMCETIRANAIPASASVPELSIVYCVRCRLDSKDS